MQQIMYKAISFFKSLFTPISVACVMADFDKKLKQLQAVVERQRQEQAKHALKIQKALEAQAKAEREEDLAKHTMQAIGGILKAPQSSSIEELKVE